MTERKILRICTYCNKEFIGNKNNCSKECLSKLRSFNIQGNKNPMFNSKRHGSLNPNWRNGISFEEYSEEFNIQLKQLIKNRDNNCCQICGKENNKCINKKGIIYGLQVHHINYNKNNNLPSNLISLCNKCHSKTNFNRDYWIRYFYEI